MRRKLSRAIVSSLVLVLVIAACGGGTTGTTQPDETSTTAGDTATTASRNPDDARTGLPEGFPDEDIPLFGEVLRGSGTVESGIWIIVTRADGPQDDARSGAEQALTDGGFEKSPDTGIFEKDPYKVLIQTAPEGGGTVLVNYSISTSFTR